MFGSIGFIQDVQLETETRRTAWLTASNFRICYTSYYLTHVRVGVGNDLLQLSDMRDFEGPETPGNLF
jgi:hypothetical protein